VTREVHFHLGRSSRKIIYADRVNFSAKPDDICSPSPLLVHNAYEEYISPRWVLAPTTNPPVDMSKRLFVLSSMKKTGLDNFIIGHMKIFSTWSAYTKVKLEVDNIA
jgi:hypothetical protein